MPVLSLSLLSRHIYGIDFKIIREFLHELTHSQDLLKTWPLTFTLTSRLQSLWYQFQNIAKFPSYHTHNLRCPHCSPALPFMAGGKKPHLEKVAHRPLTSRCPDQAWDHHLCSLCSCLCSQQSKIPTGEPILVCWQVTFISKPDNF